ncbi:MAG TPA: T9SS type A sorting domain-containing protein [Draconibacterium sp.]|nr:T9SS type A sorting domain-containing protein [Draconibacterium sp.]
MKKLIVLFCLWMIYAPVLCQKITRVEYFFNEDPGFGKGISIPLNAANHQDLTINLPLDGLNLGLNNLYVRAKTDKGKWGQTYHSIFWVTRLPDSIHSKISQVEYFFNEDPGFGKGFSIPVTVGTHRELEVNLPLNGLDMGINTVYVRIKSENGSWGQTYHQCFLVTRMPDSVHRKITAMEYFFDVDNGVGHGTPISFKSDDGVIVDITLPLASISDGQHMLYIRAKDEKGVWSGVFQQLFLKNPGQTDITLIKKVEYFINTDPGFGKGISVTIKTPQASATKIFTIAPEQLTPGNDSVYIRVQDDHGNWSPTYSTIIQTTETAAGNPPENPVVSGVTENSANLGWDAGAANGWDIVWGLSGFDYTEDGNLELNASSNTYQLKELLEGTSYEYYLRSWFSTGLVSNWAGPFSFSTSGATIINEIKSDEISIFPNPASNRIFIRFSNQNGQMSVMLSNLHGQILRNMNYSADNNAIINIDLNGISPGIYFLQIKNQQVNVTRKVIVQK